VRKALELTIVVCIISAMDAAVIVQFKDWMDTLDRFPTALEYIAIISVVLGISAFVLRMYLWMLDTRYEW